MQILDFRYIKDSIASIKAHIIHNQNANIKLANLKNNMDDKNDNNSIIKYSIITNKIFFWLSNLVEYIYTLVPSNMYSKGYNNSNIK